jgi:hypothetical protein
MTPRAANSYEAWYAQRMAAYRQGLTRHWPLVLVAFVIAVVVGVLSPDRSQPHTPPSPAPAAPAAPVR